MIYLLFIFLSFASVGWAGTSNNAVHKNNDFVVIACTNEDGKVFPPRYDGHCYSEDEWRPMPEQCLAKMEAAMREVDTYFLRPSTSIESYDGCNHCGELGCTNLFCSSGPARELRRLEWEVEQTKKRVELGHKQAEALKLWESTKRECWSKP